MNCPSCKLNINNDHYCEKYYIQYACINDDKLSFIIRDEDSKTVIYYNIINSAINKYRKENTCFIFYCDSIVHESNFNFAYNMIDLSEVNNIFEKINKMRLFI